MSYEHLFRLTRREREIADLVCRGLSSQEIADRLFIAETTVRHHLTAIYTKTGCRNRAAFVALVLKAHGYSGLDVAQVAKARAVLGV